MGRRKLKQYSGTLDPAQLAEGMNAALRNARRLTDDARTLVDAERYPTAAAMAVLAIEESGKVGVLRRLAIAPDSEIRRKAWRDYRSHRQKNAAWILPDLVAKGARDLDSLGQGIAPSGDHTAILDQVKQIALYTDCLGDAHWSQPEEVIDEQMACTLVKIAELFARDKTVTTKEVELWIDHLGSTSSGSFVGMPINTYGVSSNANSNSSLLNTSTLRDSLNAFVTIANLQAGCVR